MSYRGIEIVKNGIEIYQVLDRKFCDTILTTAKMKNEWEDSTIGVGDLNKKIRDAQVYSYGECDPINGWFTIQLWESVKKYCEKYTHCHLVKNEPPQVLKYEIGQHYKVHTDQGGLFNRQLSTVISLSDADDYEGGELSFPDIGVSYKLSKGEGVFFPSGFMYAHEVKPVMSGERYSLVTWIV